MRQVTFALRFTGRADPVGVAGDVYRAATTAPSAAVITVIGPDGVTGTHSPVPGEPATFEADLTLTGDSAFQESGTIGFGAGHRLCFSTVGNGYLTPGAERARQQGAVVFRVESGEGQFSGSSGLITSNFLIDEAMGLVDHQFGVLLLP